MSDTHYLPGNATRRGRQEQAACGAFITARQHSASPTCAKCLTWIDADEKGSASLEGVVGAPISEVPDRSDITGGRERGERR